MLGGWISLNFTSLPIPAHPVLQADARSGVVMDTDVGGINGKQKEVSGDSGH